MRVVNWIASPVLILIIPFNVSFPFLPFIQFLRSERKPINLHIFLLGRKKSKQEKQKNRKITLSNKHVKEKREKKFLVLKRNTKYCKSSKTKGNRREERRSEKPLRVLDSEAQSFAS
jgi:hypothetical protein